MDINHHIIMCLKKVRRRIASVKQINQPPKIIQEDQFSQVIPKCTKYWDKFLVDTFNAAFKRLSSVYLGY